MAPRSWESQHLSGLTALAMCSMCEPVIENTSSIIYLLHRIKIMYFVLIGYNNVLLHMLIIIHI